MLSSQRCSAILPVVYVTIQRSAYLPRRRIFSLPTWADIFCWMNNNCNWALWGLPRTNCPPWISPSSCFLHHSAVGQQHLVGGKHLGLSLRQRCSGGCWTESKSCHWPGANVPWVRCPLGTAMPYGVPKLLPSQTWVPSPTGSKANLLTTGCGKGKGTVYCRAPSKKFRPFKH